VSSELPKARIVAILQARMGSMRFPGKVMADLAGRPMLEQIIRNLRRARLITQLVVATTALTQDDIIARLADSLDVPFYRGSESDVLDRYYRAAQQFEAEIVVRLTADNPMVDGAFVDCCLGQFASADPPVDYLDTGGSPPFPVGLSVEVFRFRALEEAWREDRDPASREHVTPYIRCHPQGFRSKRVANRANDSDLRWTIDTEEDLVRVRRIYDALQLRDRPLLHTEIVTQIRESDLL
jgi:spore coat polysaccharide biosynthesis protein SpsF